MPADEEKKYSRVYKSLLTTVSHSNLATALSEFQQILSPDQTAQLSSFSTNAPTAADIVRVTDDVVKVNTARKSHIFASRIQGVLSSVQQYCTIVDTCAGPNQTAALVWGSIKLVLLISSNFTEYFDKLSERLAQFSNYCPRLSEYEKLFPASPRLQQALSDFYAVVVSFCSKALGVVQEKGIKRFLKSAWKPFKVEFKETEENLIAAKNEVMEELQLASEHATHGFRRLLTAEIEENKIFRLEQAGVMQEGKYFRSQQTLALKQSQAREIQKILRDEERQKIRLLRRILNYDYTNSLRQARALRCEGTCHWLLDKPEFRGWMEQTGPKHLWCYGIPGCGKTVLTGSVVDHLKTTFSAKDDTVIIYYFFDFTNNKSLHISTFLRCILHQAARLDSLPPNSQRRLEALFTDQVGQAEPDTDEVMKLFMHFYQKFKNAFILIDGLDEADKINQRNVKSFLKEVQKMNGARIFASTHPDMDMSKVFSHGQTLQIRPEDLECDVEVFVTKQIEEYSQEELSVCLPSLLVFVKQVLLSGAEGMFLWVDLQCKAILDACEEDGTPDRIPDLFERPPQKVTELYSLALVRLSNENNKLAELAKKVFQWVVYSQRPLSIGEIEEAISINTDQKSWRSPPFKLDLSRLCKMCGNLIKYDEATETVSLAHHTVLSFLLGCSDIPDVAGFAFEENKTEQYLADICLTYLSFTDFCLAITRTSDTTHVRALNQPIGLASGAIPSLIRPLALLPTRSRRFRGANKHVDLVNVLRNELSTLQSARTDPSFQLLEYCKTHWHSHSRYIDLQDTKRFATLEKFVCGMHLPLEWKPWSNVADQENLPYWKMFVWAVREGHTAIFYVWQSTVKMQEANYWDHLWLEEGPRLFASACTTASLEQLDMILDAKRRDKQVAQPSVDELGRALAKVCRLGHNEVVERLLQKGANVNAVGDYRTALQAAAEGGHLAVVERLLQKGADVNAAAAAGYHGRTALQAAAEGGHLAVVERLLQEGADINAAAAGDYGRTA
ncbi:hypothetical protein AOQ84DRAFT_383587, partial [Glonium stellatum]